MKPTHHALMSRVYRFLDDIDTSDLTHEQDTECAKLLALLRPIVAEPEPLVNPGKESGAGGIPWRGEHLGPRGDL